MSRLARVENGMPGFNVVRGQGGLVSAIRDAVNVCIDDRPVQGGKTDFYTKGPHTMGGTFGTAYVAAVAEGRDVFDGAYFADFIEKVNERGMATPGVHDITTMHCKHAEVVTSSGFQDKIDVKLKDPDEILRILKKGGGVQVRLSGDHNPDSPLRMNYREGETFKQDGTGYTMDMWWAIGYLDILEDALFRNLTATAKALKIKTIEVY